MATVAQRVLNVDGEGRRFAIVASRFNSEIVERLLAGAVACLVEHHVDESDIQVVRVPGAWEIVQAAGEIAALGRVDALIALGAVIRGDTPHFDHLCAECTRGLGAVAGKYRIPVSFGVLTCETLEQAQERAGGRRANKGREAALAALEMAALFKDLGS